jgi:hypothetical protein
MTRGRFPSTEDRRSEAFEEDGLHRVRWERSQRGWATLNTYASFCMSQGTASIGVVIRDHEGAVLLTAWNEAEAIAGLHGVRLVTIKERGSNRAQWDGIIQVIKALSNLLPECEFRAAGPPDLFHVFYRRKACRVSYNTEHFSLVHKMFNFLNINKDVQLFIRGNKAEWEDKSCKYD